MSVSRYKLSRGRLLHLLEELSARPAEMASLYLPPGSPRINIEGLLETILDIKTAPEDLAGIMAESPAGAVLFWGPHHHYLILPPFPIREERVSGVCEIEPLRSLLQKDYIFGLVLVRLGAYGTGVVRGEMLHSSKVGTGLVHARHRQGGSSAHRFERHREKQMETFFTRVCGHVREQLEPYERQIEFLFYGGARETVREFRRQCRFLQQFDDRTLDILLNIREPNQAGLAEAVREAWSSRLIEWKEL